MFKFRLAYVFHLGVIVLFLFLIFNNTSYNNEKVVYPELTENIVPILLENNENLTTEFEVKYDNLIRISWTFATFNKENMLGDINIQLKHNNEVLVDKNVSIQSIKDNMQYFLEFPTQKDSKNKVYQLVINGTDIPKTTTLAVWGHIDSAMQSKMDMVYSYTRKTLNVHFIIYLLLYISFLLLIKILNIKSEKKVKK